MEKTCKVCGLLKHYNSAPRTNSKASGFMGKVCWACFTAQSRADCAAKCKTEEGRLKRNAAFYAWVARNKAKVNAVSMQRHAAKLQRIPHWADLSAIKQVYTEAAKQGLHVDHVYPLRGKLVSGLHVANNLQLLTQTENSKKGNKMPHI